MCKKLVIVFLMMFILIGVVSAVRLPTVGGDDGAWGTVLNQFLNVSHNASGEISVDNIIFKLGGVIDNLVEGFVRVTGGFNVVNSSDTSQSFFFVNNSTGNVGIGTTSPNARMEIQGNASNGLALNVSGIMYVNKTSGNVGIGTTTPGAKLEVEEIVTNEGQSLLTLSSHIRPTALLTNLYSFKIASDVDNLIGGYEATNWYGLYVVNPSGTGTIQNKYGAYIQGNVGIGTTAPKGLLHVKGGIPSVIIGSSTGALGDGASLGKLIFMGDDANLGSDTEVANIEVFSTEQFGRSYDITFSTYKLGAGLRELMRINNNGNVGIGTTSPSGKLAINGTGTMLNITNGTDGSSLMVLDGSGNVGIGTTSPKAKLDVAGGGIFNLTGAQNFSIINETGTSLFHVNGTNGRVGIGTTSP
ncbi:MAG: hypothetical protein ABH832_04470, partial [bacterium]